MPNPEIDHVEVKGVTYDVAGSGGAVASVNGQTGTVVLDAEDVGALPDDYVAPVTSVNGMTGDVTVVAGVQSVNGETGDVTLDADDVGALPDDTVIPQGTVTSVQVQATSPVQSSTSTAQSTSLNTTISLANGYGDTKNPYGSKTANQVLAAPNGSNGTPSFRSLAKADLPTLTASDVGALPSSTSIPTKVSDLQNDENFIDASGAPVQSVNGQTGTVSISIPDSTSDLLNDSGFVSSQQTEKIFVQGTTPSTASDGDIWIDTATQSASGIAYLPLTAGENHPISGDVIFEEEGTPVGYIHKNEYGVSYNSMDSNGDMCGGIFSNITNGSTYVYGSGGQIVFRPYGVSDSTAQVFINSSGQIQGGITVYAGTGTIPHNYSGSEVNVNTTILSTSSLPSGKYIIAGYLSLAFSSSTSGQMYINLFHDTTALVYDLNMFTSRTSYYKTIFYPYDGSGVIKLCLDSNVASTVRGSLTVWRIG